MHIGWRHLLLSLGSLCALLSLSYCGHESRAEAESATESIFVANNVSSPAKEPTDIPGTYVASSAVKSERNGKDGFPTGQATPEGAACDLVRAYIDRNFELFNSARHARVCENRNDPHRYYALFLKHASFSHRSKSFNAETLPNSLVRLSKVYSARSAAPEDAETRRHWKMGLTLNFIEDEVFVDVVAVDSEGRDYLHRTIVHKHKYKNGNWLARPQLWAENHRIVRLKARAPSTVELPKGVRGNTQHTD